jgi:hypothetical protein
MHNDAHVPDCWSYWDWRAEFVVSYILQNVQKQNFIVVENTLDALQQLQLIIVVYLNSQLLVWRKQR